MTDEIDPNILLSCKLKKGFDKVLGKFFEMCAWIFGFMVYGGFVFFTTSLIVAMITNRVFGQWTDPANLGIVAIMYTMLIFMAIWLGYIIRENKFLLIRTIGYGLIGSTIALTFVYVVTGVSMMFYDIGVPGHPIVSIITLGVFLLVISAITDTLALDFLSLMCLDDHMTANMPASYGLLFREMRDILTGMWGQIIKVIVGFIERHGVAFGCVMYIVYLAINVWGILLLHTSTVFRDIFFTGAFCMIFLNALAVVLGLAFVHDGDHDSYIIGGGGAAITGLISGLFIMSMVIPHCVYGVDISLTLTSIVLAAYVAIVGVCWGQIALIKRKKHLEKAKA